MSQRDCQSPTGHWKAALLLAAACLSGCSDSSTDPANRTPLLQEIQAVFEQAPYNGSVWGLRVVDLNTGEVLQAHNDAQMLKIGSVRKLFSVGLALDALGPAHRFHTPIHRQGELDAEGILHGNLVLVASGDLAMGGKTLADGSFAISDYDHNEANALGNAVLTPTDPLAGFTKLAQQIAASGITRVRGDVVVDDRLFEPFDFRGEFNVGPMFVNDNVVDVLISPNASVDWQPKSALFPVVNGLTPAPKGAPLTLALEPEAPTCLGMASCHGRILGQVPEGLVPALSPHFPLIRTFRITDPSSFARSTLIEALAREGVQVDAPVVALNQAALQPATVPSAPATQVAALLSHPFQDHAKHILKVSYNVGADTSLMLLGLTQGARTQRDALAAERHLLEQRHGLNAEQWHFVDGSGGGDTAATAQAVVGFLQAFSRSPNAAVFRAALPNLGVDGSLAFVQAFAQQPELAGAKGRVQAKTGTYLQNSDTGLVLAAQALAGYISTQGGRELAFEVVVNGVDAIRDLDAVLDVFQDQGRIAALLWRHY